MLYCTILQLKYSSFIEELNKDTDEKDFAAIHISYNYKIDCKCGYRIFSLSLMYNG